MRIGTALQVAHDQCRLPGSADVQPGGRTCYFDFYPTRNGASIVQARVHALARHAYHAAAR
jgi:hypothetical protein